ncbi:MAG: hypothetical protein RLY70_4212 [Planctomycetota bacterium]
MRTSEVRLSQSERIILLAFEGLKNEEVSDPVSSNPDQFGMWRQRWKAAFTQLVAVEYTGPRDGLRKAILVVLADEHRRGRPARIKAEQPAQLTPSSLRLGANAPIRTNIPYRTALPTICRARP